VAVVVTLQTEQQKIRVRSAYAFAFCSCVLAACYVALPRLVDFPVDPLKRLAFVLQADVFVLMWVLVCVRLVSSVRFESAVDIDAALSGRRSEKLAIRAAYLQNTLEQAVIAVGVHLALATLIDGVDLSVIVGAVILFGVGRITFFLGYAGGAGGRAFGMVVTVLPTLMSFVWAIVIIAGLIWRSMA